MEGGAVQWIKTEKADTLSGCQTRCGKRWCHCVALHLRKNKYVSVLKNEFSIPAKFSMVNSKSQRMIDKSVTERLKN